MRRSRRLSVVVAILLLVIWCVVSTWDHFSGGVGTGWVTAIALSALGYLPVSILGFRVQSPLLRLVATPAAVCIALLSFGLVAAIACWVLAGTARVLGMPISLPAIGYGAFGLGLAATVYGLVNAAIIRITRYQVALSNLPAEWEGKTAVLVSDIHSSAISGARTFSAGSWPG